MSRPCIRAAVRARAAGGAAIAAIAGDLGVSTSTARRWAGGFFPADREPPAACWACDGDDPPDSRARRYAYLLGQYLGDGHLVTSTRVPVLRIYSCTDYPGIIHEVEEAITDVRGSRPGRVRRAATDRMITVQSYWMHWPCLFPQHGPGRKHERPIVLSSWQREIARQHPWPLIRGLIHSDGCRATNRVIVRGKAYSYPRYLFANESRDILAIMGDALDRAGVEWRYNRPNSISIARRRAVEEMDRHVGPKT